MLYVLANVRSSRPEPSRRRAKHASATMGGEAVAPPVHAVGDCRHRPGRGQRVGGEGGGRDGPNLRLDLHARRLARKHAASATPRPTQMSWRHGGSVAACGARAGGPGQTAAEASGSGSGDPGSGNPPWQESAMFAETAAAVVHTPAPPTAALRSKPALTQAIARGPRARADAACWRWAGLRAHAAVPRTTVAAATLSRQLASHSPCFPKPSSSPHKRLHLVPDRAAPTTGLQ
eukprot:224832-Chlamydomonas_euryale.AAC.3